MDVGRAVMDKVVHELQEFAVIENQPRVEGRNMYMIVGPKPKK
jgi:translation initiation factor IF-3